MCLVDSIDLDVMYISVEALCRLTACDALVRLPCLVDVAPGGVVDVLSGLSSYVQSSIDVDRTRWSGPGCGWCQLSDSPAASRRNRVTIQLLDSIGDSVSGMEEGDVVVYVIDKESGTAIGGSSTTVTILEDDAFEVQFLIPADSSVKRVGLNAVVSQIYTSHLALKVSVSFRILMFFDVNAHIPDPCCTSLRLGGLWRVSQSVRSPFELLEVISVWPSINHKR